MAIHNVNDRILVTFSNYPSKSPILSLISEKYKIVDNFCLIHANKFIFAPSKNMKEINIL